MRKSLLLILTFFLVGCLCLPSAGAVVALPTATPTGTATEVATSTSTELPPTDTPTLVPTDTLAGPTATRPPFLTVRIFPEGGKMRDQIHTEAERAVQLGLVPFVGFDASW